MMNPIESKVSDLVEIFVLRNNPEFKNAISKSVIDDSKVVTAEVEIVLDNDARVTRNFTFPSQQFNPYTTTLLEYSY
ncbi:hypothetical protein CEW46_21150 [Bacillus cereus]|nr:hypothetical protein CEW46_21150 [Bacillus cereus]